VRQRTGALVRCEIQHVTHAIHQRVEIAVRQPVEGIATGPRGIESRQRLIPVVQRVQRANAEFEGLDLAWYGGAHAVQADEGHGSECQQQQPYRQPSRYPASFEAGNHRSTDVRQKTADEGRHNEASQAPHEVRREKNGSERDNRFDDDPRTLRAGGGGHGVPPSCASDSL
jgi:hypothetical protein